MKRASIGATGIALLAVALAACSAVPGSGGSHAATPTAEPAGNTPSPWSANAASHRGMDGEEFEYTCSPGGNVGSIWGTDVYTDDSSVCTAAVHAGLITIQSGGAVTIEIRPGEDSYDGSEQNGVTSNDYGAWGGSFIFLEDE